MSRSLVGSSSSSTLGSAISSRVSCSRAAPRRTGRRPASTGGRPGTRAAPALRSGQLLLAEPHDCAICSWPPAPQLGGQVVELLASRRSARSAWTGARCRAAVRPASVRSSVVLPEPLTPTMPIVARPEPPGTRSTSVRPAMSRWCPPARARCGRAGWGRTRAARRCRAAAARRRSAPRRPRSGSAAWTCGRAARGAARPAPCGRGCCRRSSAASACLVRSARAKTQSA